MTKTLNKIIYRLIKESCGRFLSIMLLLALGTMTLVGLKSTGTDINKSANEYFDKLNTLDVAVIGSRGLGEVDKKEIEESSGASEVEFGNFVDTTIANSTSSIRVFSAPRKISKFEIVKGKLPTKEDEIALTAGCRDKYKIGATIELLEKDDRFKQLRCHRYKITGFVNSSEIISDTTLGSSSSGSGILNGYAVVAQDAFEAEVPVIARLRFKDLKGVGRFSSPYSKNLEKHRAKIEKLLSDNGYNRKVETGDKLKPEYHVYTHRTMPGGDGVKMLHNIFLGVGRVGNVFPIVLYLVAALVAVTGMTRFVNEERANAGVMKALGYSEVDVIKQFLIYGLIAGGIGTLLGAMLGTFGIPHVLCTSLMTNMTLPIPALKFNPVIIVFAVLISLTCSVLPALIIAHREFKETAAQLLLPKPPSKNSRILVERIRFIWRRMSFIQKVTARNIFRYKQRMMMTVFGVAGSVALLFAGLGISSSINDIEGRQFGELIKYDVIVAKSDYITDDEQTQIDDILGSADVTRYEEVYTKGILQKINGVDDEQEITLMATSKKRLKPFISTETRVGHKPLVLTKDGAVITEKLAHLLGISKGDTFTLKEARKSYTIKVSGISEMYAGHYIFMNDDYYAKVWGKTPAANAYMVKISDKSDVSEVTAKFMAADGVQAVAHNLNVIEQVRGVSKSLTTVMFVLTEISLLLAVVILYNLTNINIAERIREISTIKVLGFLNKEVTMYIYRETIVLSIVGIGLGLALGKILHDTIIAYVAPPQIMFTPGVELWVYIVPSVAVLTILAALGIYVNHTLKRINMLEALKSVD